MRSFYGYQWTGCTTGQSQQSIMSLNVENGKDAACAAGASTEGFVMSSRCAGEGTGLISTEDESLKLCGRKEHFQIHTWASSES